MSSTAPTPPPMTASTQPLNPVVTPSPRFSFKGYDPLVWLSKQKAFLKTMLSLATTALGLDAGNAPIVTGHSLLIVGACIAAIAVRFAYDALDYYFTANPA